MAQPRYPVLYRPPLVAANDQFSVFALVYAAALIVAYVFLSYLHQPQLLSDEGFHRPMIEALMRREFDKLPETVTTPPVFHAVIAFFTVISGVQEETLGLMRFFQLLLCMGALPFFYKIARTLGQPNCDIKTLICLTLPIALPYWGILYTDTPTVTLIVMAFYFTLLRCYCLAALVLCVAVGFRQLAIFWVAFCAWWGFFAECAEMRFYRALTLKSALLCGVVRAMLPFVLPLVLMLGYVVYTGSIVQGDKSAHQIDFNPSNLFMFLLLSFVLLLPHVVYHAEAVFELLRSSKLVCLVLVALLICYFAFYKITHVYNQPSQDWWLHNRVLFWSTESALNKLLFFIPISWAFLTYWVIWRNARERWQLSLVYFFGVASFVFLPLVEWRYYMVALVAFHLVNPVKSLSTERWTAALYTALSLFIVYKHVARSFFL